MDKKFYKWASLVSIFVLSFIYFYLQIVHLEFSIFTNRDLGRAWGWLNGEFYWPGPEMSGGGNLPGPFFYFLLAPPLFFGNSIYYSLLWYISWMSLTFTLAFYFLMSLCRHKESLFFFPVIMLSLPLKTLHFSFAWNAAFAVFFHILSIFSLYRWRWEGRKIKYIYILALSIGLGIQVHFFISIYLFIFLLLWVFQKDKRFYDLIPFSLIISFLLLPYYLGLYFNIFEVSEYRTHDHDLIYVLYDLFSDTWFRNIKRYFFYFWPTFLIISLLILKSWIMKKKISVTSSTYRLLWLLSIPILISIIVARKKWYICLAPIFLLIICIKILDDLTPSKRRRALFLLFGSLFIYWGSTLAFERTGVGYLVLDNFSRSTWLYSLLIFLFYFLFFS